MGATKREYPIVPLRPDGNKEIGELFMRKWAYNFYRLGKTEQCRIKQSP